MASFWLAGSEGYYSTSDYLGATRGSYSFIPGQPEVNDLERLDICSLKFLFGH